MGLFLLIASIGFFFWVSRNALAEVAATLLQAGGASVTSEHRELLDLVNRKRGLLRKLKDLEFDFETGKLTVRDYEVLRESASDDAVSAMKALDAARTRFRFRGRLARDLESFAERAGDNGEVI